MERRAAEIHENVRRVMRLRKISGVQLGDRIGMSRSAMQRRLAGETEFTAAEIGAIADELDVDVREFYGLVVDSTPDPEPAAVGA